MKKSICFTTVLFGLSACVSNDLPRTEPKEERKSNFEMFSVFGDVHNYMLGYVSENFECSKCIPSSYEEAIDCVFTFQATGVNYLPISLSDKTTLTEGLNQYKEYYVTRNLMHDLAPPSTRTDVVDDNFEEVSLSKVYELINEAHDINAIDEFETLSFISLVEHVLANENGSLSNDEFEDIVRDLIKQWEKRYQDVDFSQFIIEVINDDPDNLEFSSIDIDNIPNGALSGIVLNIALSSLEYWKNGGDMDYTRVIPPFVGADIAGAVIGAVNSAVGQYITSGHVSCGRVAWGAASGAIVGSTGIVGKVGKWISSLF